jgi:hypothetical protein
MTLSPTLAFHCETRELSLTVPVALLNSQNVHVSETTVSKAIGGDSAASQIGDTSWCTNAEGDIRMRLFRSKKR